MNKVVDFLNECVNVFGVDTMRGAVAQSILDNASFETDREVVTFMNDVTTYGCISGCVSGMIYYRETVAFFDEFHEYIYDMLLDFGMEKNLEKMSDIRFAEMDEEYADMMDFDVDIEKNNLAWMGYELIVCDLLETIECEGLLAV
jgi:hypothetical protein